MPFIDIFRALGALLFTLGLLLGIAWLVKKYDLMNGMNNVGKKDKRLKIIEQLWLDGGKTRLAIIEIDGTEEVLLIGPNGANQIVKKLKPNPKKEAANAPII